MTPAKIDQAKKNLWWSTGALIRFAKGTKIAQSKLTPKTVLGARTMRKQGKPVAEIARHFGVAQQTISDVINKNTWKHIK